MRIIILSVVCKYRLVTHYYPTSMKMYRKCISQILLTAGRGQPDPAPVNVDEDETKTDTAAAADGASPADDIEECQEACSSDEKEQVIVNKELDKFEKCMTDSTASSDWEHVPGNLHFIITVNDSFLV